MRAPWLILLVGCGGGSGTCVTESACDALYEPTYDNIFEQALKPTCGIDGKTCHSAEGAAGGLVFDDIDQTYTTLSDGGYLDGECAELVARIDALDDPALLMPPGAALSDAERCAIRKWIDDGAPR